MDGSTIITPLYGHLLVSRDPDIGTIPLAENKFAPDKKFIIMPDVEKRRTQSGVVHAHNMTGDWEADEGDIVGCRILWSKYAEREFTINNHTFCIVDERDVLAIFTGVGKMTKADLLKAVDDFLADKSDELTSEDLTNLSTEIESLAETEQGVEDGDEDPADEKSAEEKESER